MRAVSLIIDGETEHSLSLMMNERYSFSDPFSFRSSKLYLVLRGVSSITGRLSLLLSASIGSFAAYSSYCTPQNASVYFVPRPLH